MNRIPLIDFELINNSYSVFQDDADTFGGIDLFDLGELKLLDQMNSAHELFLYRIVNEGLGPKDDMRALGDALSALTLLVKIESRSDGLKLLSNYFRVFDLWSDNRFSSQLPNLRNSVLDRIKDVSFQVDDRDVLWNSFSTWVQTPQVKRWLAKPVSLDTEERAGTISSTTLKPERKARITLPLRSTIRIVTAILPESLDQQLQIFKIDAFRLWQDLKHHEEKLSLIRSYVRKNTKWLDY